MRNLVIYIHGWKESATSHGEEPDWASPIEEHDYEEDVEPTDVVVAFEEYLNGEGWEDDEIDRLISKMERKDNVLYDADMVLLDDYPASICLEGV